LNENATFTVYAHTADTRSYYTAQRLTVGLCLSIQRPHTHDSTAPYCYSNSVCPSVGPYERETLRYCARTAKHAQRRRKKWMHL